MQNVTATGTRTRKMVQLAILVAIMLVLAFTPLGYPKFGLVEITLMILPVAVGAIVLGPAAGAVLGGVFGLTSFLQCFGTSAFGMFILNINPWLTLFICMIPRILCGWLSGLLFRALSKIDRTRMVSYIAASLSTALLNTIFFMTCIIVFFWHNNAFIDKMNSWGITTDSVWLFLIAFIGLNGIVEAAVNATLGAAVSKTVMKISEKINK